MKHDQPSPDLTGRSCINFKRLEDLKLDVAMGLVKEGAKSVGINAVK